MMSKTDLKLTYDIPALVAAEAELKRPISLIVAELQSDAGASVTTLRVLLAAGTTSTKHDFMEDLRQHLAKAGLPAPQSAVVRLDLAAADTVIGELGLPAITAAISVQFGACLRDLMKQEMANTVEEAA